MPTHFEETLQRDIDRIRARVSEMAELDQRALRDGLRALQERNRQLAYAVILRDQRIDELDKEIDGLCLQFLVRQQPVAGPLRFVYATIRINLELERVGDYAESIARQVIKLLATNVAVPTERFAEIAHLSIPMLRDAVQAFITQDVELAKETMEVEEAVDLLRHSINGELVAWREQDKIPIEGLTALMTIARRFERVSDQAKNICQEVIYMCTGEYSRHKAHGVFRLLFVDEDNACRSQMAEGIGTALHLPQFVFSSAGQDPKPIDPRVVSFMQQKGIDISGQRPKRIGEVPELEHHHVFIGLARDVQKALPPPPRKTVYLDWTVPDPSRAKGSPEQIAAAYESTYREIEAHIRDLVGAIVGEEIEIQNKTYA